MADVKEGIQNYADLSLRGFSGIQAIDWFLQKGVCKTRQEGRKLGKKLMDSNLLYHVTFEKPFLDGNYQYFLRVCLLNPCHSL
jgi:hypothetical protein